MIYCYESIKSVQPFQDHQHIEINGTTSTRLIDNTFGIVSYFNNVCHDASGFLVKYHFLSCFVLLNENPNKVCFFQSDIL